MILKIIKDGKLICRIERNMCIEELVRYYINHGYEVEKEEV